MEKNIASLAASYNSCSLSMINNTHMNDRGVYVIKQIVHDNCLYVKKLKTKYLHKMQEMGRQTRAQKDGNSVFG